MIKKLNIFQTQSEIQEQIENWNRKKFLQLIRYFIDGSWKFEIPLGIRSFE